MCGVVGMIGQGNVQEMLISGLEKLEYRGYDSAGIFVRNHQKQEIFKEVGRIATLKETVNMEMPAHLGIGHTRWATHGPATQYNAHPHKSSRDRFIVVHNGVIENYLELKDEYLTDVTFKSDTDTEVVVQLIEYFALKEGLSGQESFLRVLQLLKGSYAFALIDNETPDVLYAAKNKSPLLVGIGEGAHYVVSDAMAAIHLTNDYLEIHDLEFVVLSANNVEIFNFEGEKQQRVPFKAELDIADLEKGMYPFYMLKEIEEQPAIMRRLISAYQESPQLENGSALLKSLAHSDRLHIVACGTSYHAGWIGKSLIEKLTGRPVEVHLASEFAYDLPLMSERPMFIFLTQSGETADSRQALVKVNELGYPSLTITNVKGSTLSREATYTLLLHAGPEIAVASTKAYTAQIAVLAILADALREYLEQPQIWDMAQELSRVANVMDSILADKQSVEHWVNEQLLLPQNAFYIGRLSDYFVAMEAALKLKEITYIHTEAFAAGELKHGTIALIEDGTPVIAVMSDATVAAHTRANIEEVKARGAAAFVITMENIAKAGDQFIVPEVTPLLSPLVMVVVTQLIAYYTALGRGLDVDKPRNLAKSVTVE